MPNHSAFRKRNPTSRIILPSGNQRTILAPILGSGPSDSMRSSAALLKKRARAPAFIRSRSLWYETISNPLSYPHPRQPTVRFLLATQRRVKHEKSRVLRTLRGTRPPARAFRSRCLLYRNADHSINVSDCETLRSQMGCRLRSQLRLARHTRAD